MPGRNDPCYCGSGKKFKKCHLGQDSAFPTTGKAPSQPLKPEPYLDLVPSIVWPEEQKRVRVVFNRVHLRPLSESFHDFLVAIVKWTFTEEWWKHQVALSDDRQHVVVKWDRATAALGASPAERIETDGTRSRRASGQVWSLLQLGYDLYCLQNKNCLPDFVVEKLRDNKRFQSARYEMVAAAIMQRGGFDVNFLNDAEIAEKHCEFIGVDRVTHTRVAVEAKSRRRPGTLNEPPSDLPPPANDVKGLENLIRKAKKQRHEGLPLLLFLDVNRPWSPDVKGFDKQWIADLRRVYSKTATPQEPDPFTAVFATNFAGHYAQPNERQIHPEWVTIIPQFSEKPVHPAVLFRLDETIRRYSIFRGTSELPDLRRG